jgi:hypothetical protein
VPEVVEHGVTGFIVDDEKEALQAIKYLPELDPSRVRNGFERRVTARRMAEDYFAITACSSKTHRSRLIALR